jgi:methyltransferase (TIGR00027 family)
MPRGASITAEAVCFFRALEQTRPPSRRIVDDPFAARMLSPTLASLAAMPAVRKSIAATGTAAIGGLQRFVAARHRIIDERMLEFVARGGSHVVILGAGYDTRAWRLADALRGVVVAELDFPATQARKRNLIARQRIPTPAMAPPTFVPIDFEQQRLGDVLANAGYQGDAPVFFIWEGVTMYLDPATVTATLDALARAGGAGSELIFDAWSAPTGSGLAAIRRFASGGLRFVGEPLKFSLAPQAASAMLQGSGWQLERVYQPHCIEAALGLQRDTVFPDTHLVHAALR